MSIATLPSHVPYVHPDDPANNIGPGEPFLVDGLDWSWAFVVYKDIEGFPGYKVGSNGSVWSRFLKYHRTPGVGAVMGDSWNCLTPQRNKGHLYLTLSRNKKKFSIAVHTVVLENFLCRRPEGLECCHNDGNGFNDRIYNIRWDTRKENMRDRVRHGMSTIGERHGSAKLTEGQVRDIRETYAMGGISQLALAERFKISQQTLSKIVNGKNWTYVN